MVGLANCFVQLDSNTTVFWACLQRG